MHNELGDLADGVTELNPPSKVLQLIGQSFRVTYDHLLSLQQYEESCFRLADVAALTFLYKSTIQALW